MQMVTRYAAPERSQRSQQTKDTHRKSIICYLHPLLSGAGNGRPPKDEQNAAHRASTTAKYSDGAICRITINFVKHDIRKYFNIDSPERIKTRYDVPKTLYRPCLAASTFQAAAKRVEMLRLLYLLQ